jgi:thiamine biosynthesis lipoprotein
LHGSVTASPNISTARFEALGTTAQVTALEPRALPPALEVLATELAAIDVACSRFRTDSEVVRLAAAGARWVDASSLLREALATGIRVARLTGGDVDPTVGRSLRALGWDSDFSIVVTRAEGDTRIDAVPAAGWRRIEIDDDRGRVRVPAGVEIDLGATAKALAADRSAVAAFAATGTGVLVNLGGDLAVAGPAPAGGWSVRVTDDHRAGASAEGQTIAIESGGLATSSTTVRRWRTRDGEMHHIVDPRTGLPAAAVWRTVSVCAPSCVDANAAATAAIVRGEAAPAWLQSRGMSARLVRSDGDVVRTCGWPDELDATAWAA